MCPGPRSHRGRASFAHGQNFREVGLHQCPSERTGEGAPVRRLRVPSHVPSHSQTAAKVRGFSPIASGFTAETDWLLEQRGFELLVPRVAEERWRTDKLRSRVMAVVGTGPPMSAPFTVGPGVRIPFAPARSQQRTLWLPGASHAGGTQRCYGAGGEEMAPSSLWLTDGVPRCPSRTT